MKKRNNKGKTVIILSITSDIGFELVNKYLKDGYEVIGTYRNYGRLDEIKSNPKLHLFACDITQKKDSDKFIASYKQMETEWDIFISCVGDLFPLKAFFQCDFESWSRSVDINAVEQLRILHGLYPFRRKRAITNVVFFAGGGVNKAVVNFSAYTISKIMLIKMCEYLDAENKDMNIFIVGPGWTKTKIHHEVITSLKASKQKIRETLKFLKDKEGTSMQDIYDCIGWLVKQGKKVAGGRNFSVVNDLWKGEKNRLLAKALKMDPDMYKLRRHRNDYK